MICSRAPNCGGYGYKELNKIDKMPNPQKCEGDNGGKGRGCNGWVPLCCYEMARTGDFKKCIGYWERLWCTPSQCNQAQANGASNSQCGGNCQCAHAFKTYCGNVPPIPLKVRLEGKLPYGAPYHPEQPSPTIIPSISNYISPFPTRLSISPIPSPTSPPPQLTHYFFPSPTKKITNSAEPSQLPSININSLKITLHKTTNFINQPIVKIIKIDRTIENAINRFFIKLINSL